MVKTIGCEACEGRRDNEAYVSLLELAETYEAGDPRHKPGVFEVTVDGRFNLCAEHRDALLALLGAADVTRRGT